VANQNQTEAIAVLAQITPAAARASSSYFSDAFDWTRFQRAVATLQIGTLAGAATINLRFQHNISSVSSHSAWADVNATSCITSTFASGSNDKIARLEVRIDQNSALKTYGRALVTVAASTWIGNVIVHGYPAIYSPASQYNHADVVATVVF
jgi:hypothetical protein